MLQTTYICECNLNITDYSQKVVRLASVTDGYNQLWDELLDNIVHIVSLYHSSPLIISGGAIPALFIDV